MIFHADDTTPKRVDWIDGPGGFVIAALPGLHPALILLDPPNESAPMLAELLHLACTLGAPRNDLKAIYTFDTQEGLNAPVSKIIATNMSNMWTIHAIKHPSITEEQWVYQQVRLAGVI